MASTKSTAAAGPGSTPADDPKSFLEARVAKRFGEDIFCGTITDNWETEDGTPLWHVEYDDGDREDFGLSEAKAAIALFRTFVQQGMANELPAQTYAARRKRRRVAAKSCSDDAFDAEIGDGEPDDERKCIMCVAHGRTPKGSVNDPAQLLPIRLKPSTGKGAGKVTVAHIHACCALRAPPSSPLKGGEKPPSWWTEVADQTHGYPNLPPSRCDSTSPMFVPYAVTFSDWVDELALYDARKLRASARRFDEGRLPPYNSVGGVAALWRCDDRGSIGYCRMCPSLVETARELRLSPAEAALWGAVAYRCFNRLSTFSRWAAAKALAAKLGRPVSDILAKTSNGGTSTYEERCHGPPGVRSEEFHAMAASGVSLHGRHGYRDRWGREFCEEQMDGKRTPMCCVAELPLPSEMSDFKTFIKWEGRRGRGVMTGEHQVQPKERILAMLSRLAANDCARLRKMNAAFRGAGNVKAMLDELQKLDTVGPFFAWQIFSDLVAVQHHCRLFTDNTILPSWAVRDSLFDYALLGPGARKGAYIIDGGASVVLELDKDTSQGAALERARRILAEFGAALKRTGLEKGWKECARGRPYDLETLEHSLCGFYGTLVDHGTNVVLADAKSNATMANVAEKANCTWPPEAGGPSHSASTREKQGGPAWRPNPCTALERADLVQMVAHAADGQKESGAASIKKEEGGLKVGPRAKGNAGGTVLV